MFLKFVNNNRLENVANLLKARLNIWSKTGEMPDGEKSLSDTTF